jgi:hypothetical protein
MATHQASNHAEAQGPAGSQRAYRFFRFRGMLPRRAEAGAAGAPPPDRGGRDGRRGPVRALTRRGAAEGERLAREAIEAIDHTEYPIHRGHTRLALGQALREQAREQESLDAAREAVALYEAKGATAWLTRARRMFPEA